MIGSTIAHYRITAKLGEGGMGVVYRATDDRLNRDVAIKLLPDSVEQDPARLARFKREAQTLAALSHGNIAQVYGLEEHDGQHAIVLELVEGEDLAERIRRGPLPLEDACEIARQIAEALEAAHEKGIVHRDLKPANIKIGDRSTDLSPGTVKVLDFGLAKALVADPAEQDLSNSPTMTAAATQAGIILGTAAYMAPEQAKGKPVDRRADIWAFGCVLYEMLSGRAPFDGDGVSELLAHVITKEPDFDALPDGLPGMLVEMLQRCLRKDPRRRLPDIAVARITLLELDAEADVPEIAAPAPPPRSILFAWWLPGALGLLLGLALAWAALSGDAPVPTATHFDLVLDPPAQGEIALSSDASMLVYAGKIAGVRRLFVRRLDTHASAELPGTEGAGDPFFSPDDRHVGFFAAGRIKRVSLAGGLPETVAAAAGGVTGAIWTPDDRIVFTTSALRTPHSVDASGGEATRLPVDGLGPGLDIHAPRLLPDGRTLLATHKGDSPADAEIITLDMETGAWTPLIRGSDARFVAPDRLLFVQQEQLLVTGFDPRKRETFGDPQPAELYLPGVERWEGLHRFRAGLGAEGTLVYPSGTIATISDVVRVTAGGETRETGLTGVGPRVDVEGRRVVACRQDNSVHLLDLVDGTDTQLTFMDTSWYPMWSHDDSLVLFSDRRNGAYETWAIPPDGSGTGELHFENPMFSTITTSTAADGTLMGYGVEAATSRDIWIRRPDGTLEVVLQTPANERVPTIAPDGRLFAYVSDEQGSDQIYLRDLEETQRRWAVTSEGGMSPVWSRDGRHLFFIRGDSIFAVEVRTAGGVRVGEERLVFTHERLDFDDWGNRTFDTLPNGDLLVSVQRESSVALRVILGFAAEP